MILDGDVTTHEIVTSSLLSVFIILLLQYLHAWAIESQVNIVALAPFGIFLVEIVTQK